MKSWFHSQEEFVSIEVQVQLMHLSELYIGNILLQDLSIDLCWVSIKFYNHVFIICLEFEETFSSSKSMLNIKCQSFHWFVERLLEVARIENINMIRSGDSINYEINNLSFHLDDLASNLKLVQDEILVNSVNEYFPLVISLLEASIDEEILAELILGDGKHVEE